MIRSVIAAVAMVAAATAAQAKIVVIDQVVDAAKLGNGSSPSVYFGEPFTLSPGDTLTVNFSFLPGQAFSIVDPTAVGMLASAKDDVETETHNSMTFVGLQGAAHNPADRDSGTSGFGIHNFFYPSNFMDGGTGIGIISFTGAQFSTTILSYSKNVLDREYSAVYLFGNGASVSVVTTVPEPAGYLLLLLGLVAVGRVSHRRRVH